MSLFIGKRLRVRYDSTRKFASLKQDHDRTSFIIEPCIMLHL